MKRALLYLLLLAVFTVGCTADKTMSRLKTADSLLTNNKPDSALTVLNGIKDTDINSDESRAYYSLLKYQTSYRLSKSMPNDSLIDESIKYYEKHSDGDLLARAYYYKGELMCQRGDMSKGVVYTKKAEQSVEKSNFILLHHIYESLAYYNLIVHEYSLSLIYAKKATDYAQKAENTDWELYDLSLMVNNYDKLEMPDSTALYVDRCISLLDKASEEIRSFVLSDLGIFFQKSNPEKAERLINENIRIKPNAVAYTILAVLRYNKDNKANIDPILEKAFCMANDRQKITVLQVWRDYKTAEKQYKEANELSTKLMALEDSITKTDQKQGLRAAQMDFDNNVKEVKSQKIIGYTAMAAAILIVAVAGLMCYFRRKDAKLKQQLEHDREEIKKINQQIKEVLKTATENETQRTKKEKELKLLLKRSAEVEERHSGILVKGRRLYLEIQKGTTTAKWSTDDFRNFVEYYKIVNPEYVSLLESNAKRLTNKNKTAAILENMGYAIEDIAKIMATSAGAVRTARSRREINETPKD